MQAPSQRPKLEEVAAAESRRLANDPNILCVGYGLKQSQGRATLVAALQYYVRSKLASADEIRRLGSEPVAGDVAGYKTDVIAATIARPAACPDSNRPTGLRGERIEDPLVGGTSTAILGDFSSFATAYGTLGGICFDTSSGAAMALSNAHVYGTETGHDAIQPFPPAGDYAGGAIEWLACGGPLSHLFTWTAPTPLTDILTAAAAGAWVAAAASDAEDPNRWGQRVTPVPAPGVTTSSERIHLEAHVPRIPFPGRHWRTKTRWEYTRTTSAGEVAAAVHETRENEHVLVGKRVFTDHDVYAGGQQVRICAEIWTAAGGHPARFVVAHCFPIADPGRPVLRVLQNGALCERIDASQERLHGRKCIHGFAHQVQGVAQVNFPLVAAPFVFIGEDASELLDSGPGNPTGVTALRLPGRPLSLACPPGTHVEVGVFHAGAPVHIRAISANGNTVSEADSPGEPGVLHIVRLSGPEIVRLVLKGGKTKSWVASVCVDKRRLDITPWQGIPTWYSGTFTLPSNEPEGKWAVVVVTQTLDTTPTGGDPIQAARKLGGIVDSANVVETGECACEILYDATFDVKNG